MKGWRTGALGAVAGVAICVMGISGCRSLGRAVFREPVVTLREVVVTGVGLSGGSLDIVLSVQNPNGYALDALRMTYRVDVDSTMVGEGALSERFVVASRDSSVVRVPVRFTFAGLGAAGRALLSSGLLTYRVRGDFTVATPLGNFTRPYDRVGRYSTLARSGR